MNGVPRPCSMFTDPAVRSHQRNVPGIPCYQAYLEAQKDNYVRRFRKRVKPNAGQEKQSDVNRIIRPPFEFHHVDIRKVS